MDKPGTPENSIIDAAESAERPKERFGLVVKSCLFVASQKKSARVRREKD